MTRSFFLGCLVLAGCTVGEVDDLGPGGDPSLDDPPTDPTDPTDPPPPQGVTYSASIAPKLAFCAGCHAKANPDGGYRTDSYQGLLGAGKDAVPNVIAGDANSLLVLYMAPAPGKDHKGVSAAVPGLGELVRNWVVASSAAQQ